MDNIYLHSATNLCIYVHSVLNNRFYAEIILMTNRLVIFNPTPIVL